MNTQDMNSHFKHNITVDYSKHDYSIHTAMNKFCDFLYLVHCTLNLDITIVFFTFK